MGTEISTLIRNLGFFGLSIMVGMVVVASASAQVVFNVNSDADQLDENAGTGIYDGVCRTAANTCTLRAAILEANRIGGAGATIVLPAGTYVLTRDPASASDELAGDLNLTTPVSGNPVIALSGAGAAVTIIDANLLDRVLFVHSGRTATISGVTLRNGRKIGVGHGAYGGGIYNDGVLTVNLSIISNNAAPTGLGGGIFSTGGTLALSQCTLSGNVSAGAGGGIFNNSGSVEVNQSTITGNVSTAEGGGIFNVSILFVTNSTISGNSSNNDGGGIYNLGTTSINNSTISFNQANADNDANGTGAGVYNRAGQTLNLRSSVVAGNNLGGERDYDDCTGALSSYGRNKFGTLSGCPITQFGLGDFTLLASLDELATLQENGGPTRTHALVAGSSMIDGAEATFGCADKNGVLLATDQRGAPRVAGVRCDIGAYEFGAILSGPLLVDGFEQAGQ